MVGTWGMCCVYKANVFRKQNYLRFYEGQFTKVGCNTNVSKQFIIVGYLGRTALDDDRSGGRVDGMEWCGPGWGRGLGWGLGRGRGEGEGEGSGNRSILDCSNMMMVLCVSCAKQVCFVKHIIVHLLVVIVPIMGFAMAGGGWVVVVVWIGGVGWGCPTHMLGQCIIVGYLGGSVTVPF